VERSSEYCEAQLGQASYCSGSKVSQLLLFGSTSAQQLFPKGPSCSAPIPKSKTHSNDCDDALSVIRVGDSETPSTVLALLVHVTVEAPVESDERGRVGVDVSTGSSDAVFCRRSRGELRQAREEYEARRTVEEGSLAGEGSDARRRRTCRCRRSGGRGRRRLNGGRGGLRGRCSIPGASSVGESVARVATYKGTREGQSAPREQSERREKDSRKLQTLLAQYW